MNPIEELRDYIKQKYPKATVDLIAPLRKDGFWSLDVDLRDKKLAIEWGNEIGFGVSTVNPDNYGERTDEAYSTLKEIKRRVDRLLTSNESTSPPCGVMLSRLREYRGVTQRELATRLGVKQSSISGIEGREDIQLKTLNRAVEALGGELEIFGVFHDERYLIGVRSRAFETKRPPTSGKEDIMPPTGMSPTILNYNKAFPKLKAVGCLEQVTERAHDISARRAVLVMP
jgi:transcriptional regulator with XRE-family HTH domain